jgi:hypothetical protein
MSLIVFRSNGNLTSELFLGPVELKRSKFRGTELFSFAPDQPDAFIEIVFVGPK